METIEPRVIESLAPGPGKSSGFAPGLNCNLTAIGVKEVSGVKERHFQMVSELL
jgi:hypothetical protein